jgi:hypothetical protein
MECGGDRSELRTSSVCEYQGELVAETSEEFRILVTLQNRFSGSGKVLVFIAP